MDPSRHPVNQNRVTCSPSFWACCVSHSRLPSRPWLDRLLLCQIVPGMTRPERTVSVHLGTGSSSKKQIRTGESRRSDRYPGVGTMGMDLEGEGGDFHFDIFRWSAVLTLAENNGW